MFACIRECVCVCEGACIRACIRECVHACVRASVLLTCPGATSCHNKASLCNLSAVRSLVPVLRHGLTAFSLVAL